MANYRRGRRKRKPKVYEGPLRLEPGTVEVRMGIEIAPAPMPVLKCARLNADFVRLWSEPQWENDYVATLSDAHPTYRYARVWASKNLSFRETGAPVVTSRVALSRVRPVQVLEARLCGLKRYYLLYKDISEAPCLYEITGGQFELEEWLGAVILLQAGPAVIPIQAASRRSLKSVFEERRQWLIKQLPAGRDGVVFEGSLVGAEDLRRAPGDVIQYGPGWGPIVDTKKQYGVVIKPGSKVPEVAPIMVVGVRRIKWED